MSNLADIRPGQVFGRYEFLAPIAQGGMASVWAARQWGSRGFSKIVAVKTMLPTISDDPKFERMFLDEARIASKIRHNHVVEILDLGEQNSVLYLVMEWVDGESLSAIRRFAAEHGGVPVAVAVRIIADVCSGLHAAHELCDDEGQPFGLVHRDVSPQNILVGYDGVSKVLDFGVAKVAGRTTETTNIGHARGKPPYMAPEQALGQPIDRRADVFSLGIVLYQLVSGRHPFRGENDIATLHNIISVQPTISPKAFVANLPLNLERIMLRALERDPAKRFQTAREMELSLEALFDDDVARVRAEEIGQLVATWLGSRGEERRQALREAIRQADNSETTLLGRTTSGNSSRMPSDAGVGDENAKAVGSGRAQENGARDVHTERDLELARELNERTVVDMRPIRQRFESVGFYDELPQRGLGIRSGRWRRTGIVIVLAMCTGAVVTWAFVGTSSRTIPNALPVIETNVVEPLPITPSSMGANTTEANTTEIDATTLDPAITDKDANVRGVPSAVPTVTVESKTTRTSRQNNTQSKKRPSGPSYNLPPIPSPGF